jgi:hypothetical protein
MSQTFAEIFAGEKLLNKLGSNAIYKGEIASTIVSGGHYCFYKARDSIDL